VERVTESQFDPEAFRRDIAAYAANAVIEPPHVVVGPQAFARIERIARTWRTSGWQPGAHYCGHCSIFVPHHHRHRCPRCGRRGLRRAGRRTRIFGAAMDVTMERGLTQTATTDRTNALS